MEIQNCKNTILTNPDTVGSNSGLYRMNELSSGSGVVRGGVENAASGTYRGEVHPNKQFDIKYNVLVLKYNIGFVYGVGVGHYIKS